jgi:hypothetical protein
MKKLFDYTPWQVLEIYSDSACYFCVQVRMNKRTGFKHFKVNRVTSMFNCCHNPISLEKINELTNS